jgi:drug/metabolite transporter (DMT)-like permease
MILSTLVQSWNWLSLKIMYINNPELNGLQIIFARSICSIIILIVYLNTTLKYVMIDSFPQESKGLMGVRVFTGLIGISAMLHAAKWFSLTTITVIVGLNPVITMVAGVCYLKETISRADTLCIFLSFLGVILMTFGLVVDEQPSSEDSNSLTTTS